MISIVNKSTLVPDSALPAIVHALSVQLARDVAPIHGVVPALELVAPGATPTGDAIMTILDDPDQAGALGYHDETQDGKPLAKIFVKPTIDNGGTITTGPNSVSVTMSHELCEMVGDSACNGWSDGPDGSDYAQELCDAVEGDAYDIEGVSVSNFLFPAFFDPKAEFGSRLDHMGTLAKPFTMTPGGYQIVRSETGSVSQVFAATFPDWKRASKAHKLARRSA